MTIEQTALIVASDLVSKDLAVEALAAQLFITERSNGASTELAKLAFAKAEAFIAVRDARRAVAKTAGEAIIQTALVAVDAPHYSLPNAPQRACTRCGTLEGTLAAAKYCADTTPHKFDSAT